MEVADIRSSLAAAKIPVDEVLKSKLAGSFAPLEAEALSLNRKLIQNGDKIKKLESKIKDIKNPIVSNPISRAPVVVPSPLPTFSPSLLPLSSPKSADESPVQTRDIKSTKSMPSNLKSAQSSILTSSHIRQNEKHTIQSESIQTKCLKSNKFKNHYESLNPISNHTGKCSKFSPACASTHVLPKRTQINIDRSQNFKKSPFRNSTEPHLDLDDKIYLKPYKMKIQNLNTNLNCLPKRKPLKIRNLKESPLQVAACKFSLKQGIKHLGALGFFEIKDRTNK